jgi:UDP-N-acetylmuramoyl-tripeptide--D-alanyl-D-alanine ligase
MATGAERIGPPARVRCVATDTRTLERGALFVALHGAQHDGHAFVVEAMRRGAAALLVSRPCATAVPEYVVADTLAAYQALARLHRERCATPLVAVTGTNGKTTVKEMIAHVLAAHGAVLASEKNFNNHIGVPMTLLQLAPDHSFVVVEMGMNHAGEIARLAQLALPAVAVITNAGRGHLEHLHTVEAVVQAKLEVLDGLRDGGTLILPRDSAHFATMAAAARARDAHIVSFGMNPAADVRVHLEDTTLAGCALRVTTRQATARLTLRAPGAHNALNAAAALAAALAIAPHLDLTDAAAALDGFAAVALRCQIEEAGGVTFVSDCYNANPDSMQAALTLVRDTAPSLRRLLVLGDMCELGATAAEAHRELGAAAAAIAPALLITVGAQARLIADAARDAGLTNGAVHVCATTSEAAAALTARVAPGDCILIKGSRAMRLEEVLIAVRNHVTAV